VDVRARGSGADRYSYGRGRWTDGLAGIQTYEPDTAVVVLTSFGSMRCDRSDQARAYDYLAKPFKKRGYQAGGQASLDPAASSGKCPLS
jgi:hypothetical protein